MLYSNKVLWVAWHFYPLACVYIENVEVRGTHFHVPVLCCTSVGKVASSHENKFIGWQLAQRCIKPWRRYIPCSLEERREIKTKIAIIFIYIFYYFFLYSSFTEETKFWNKTNQKCASWACSDSMILIGSLSSLCTLTAHGAYLASCIQILMLCLKFSFFDSKFKGQ